MAENTIVRFEDVSCERGNHKQSLEEVSFPIRRGGKITLMGQNGAGKSTLFGLITGALKPEDGTIHIERGLSIALSRQVIPRDELKLTVREFFQKVFPKKMYDIDPRIDDVLEVVHLKGHEKVHDRMMSTFSGGEQARLLLAFALIQNPDILLLDEPTNNLDKAGIVHLTKFLVEYQKTVIVISHDAQFLNAFTHGVLYLDIYKQKIEQYVGDYLKVVEEIKLQIDRERRENARLERDISNRKDQMNFFAQKGGHMRDVARKMREAIEELEDQLVEMRHEDKTIAQFRIPSPDIVGPIVKLGAVSIVKNGKPVSKKTNVTLKKGQSLLISGPNGVGKTTFLKKLAAGEAKDVEFGDGVTLGYYAQDFSALEESKTAFESLLAVMKQGSEEGLRSCASRFLFDDALLRNHVGSLSEGQRGLLCFARFMAQQPSLLILDEPTNHINFRHLPIIAKALDEYQGALIVVSHMAEFTEQIKFDETLDLGAF